MNVNQDPSPVNYEPNSYTTGPVEDPSVSESEAPLVGRVVRQRIEKRMISHRPESCIVRLLSRRRII